MNMLSTIAAPRRQAPPSRVVFINRYFFPDMSATSQILHDLAARLTLAGIEVHVVCSRQLYQGSKANLPAQDCIAGIRVHRIRTTSLGRNRLAGRALDYLSFYCTCAVTLVRLLRSDDVVVAKTDPPLISVVAAVIARLRGATLVNWLQDIFPEIATQLGASPLPGWIDMALRRVRDSSLRAARANVVLGTQMRDYIVGRRVPDEQIRIIENWAGQDETRSIPAQSSQLRGRLGLSDHFVVGYSGNLGRAHDFRTILDAAAILAVNPRIVFLMIGGGVNMDLLKEQAKSLNLRNMRFLPYQPRAALSDSLAAADVHLACLLPQLEGLIVPSKFYGILAAGRPLVFIGKSDGELARIIQSARCGLAVTCGDGRALADALLKFQASPEDLLAMGSRARELFLGTYTAERAATQWLNLLEELRVEAPSSANRVVRQA